MRRNLALAVFILFVANSICSAQFGFGGKAIKGVVVNRPLTQRWKVGVEIRATQGPLSRIYATAPVPTDWPAQQVRIDDEEITTGVRVSYRTLDNGVRQMLINTPPVPAKGFVKALVTFEVTKAAVQGPADPSIFKISKRIPRDVRRFLSESPFIESRNSKIRKLAREVIKDVDGDWQRVEAIYDWVREKVKYKDGKLKGALAALRDGTGDCEELTSLFIAMCRANRIPARTVWVPGHCYPEFYLVDDEGKGHWFPCQAAGDRAFGSMPDQRPILQKGDNFRVPEKKKPQRYVAEYLEVRGVGKPQVRFVRQLLPGAG